MILGHRARRATALALLAGAMPACTLVRDLDYLGPGGAQPLPDLCPQGGWCALAGTKLRAVCPPSNAQHDYAYTCPEVITGRNGAVYDPARQRLVIWGGGSGQSGHFGNEVYAVSVVDSTVSRLTDPSPTPECTTELPDGTPHSRSTHDGLAAAVDADRMLAFGADIVCGFSADTWQLDLASAAWSHLAPTGPPGCDAAMDGSCAPGGLVGIMADYDPVTKAVFVKDPYRLWRYLVEENRYEVLRDDVPSSYATTGRIDPDRRLFVYTGCSPDGDGCTPTLSAISIDPEELYANFDWSAEQAGCEPLMESDAPGFSYDSRQKRFVGWPGEGGTVYVLDPDTRACTPASFEGGPPPPAGETRSTYGRFRYMPDLDAFVVVNDIDNDAYVLRL